MSVFVCWLLTSSGHAWPLLDIIGWQRLQPLVLIKHLSKLCLMPSFLVHSISSCKFCHMLFPHCQIPVHHQLFLQHPCTCCMLARLFSQRYLDPSFTQKAFSGVWHVSQRCVEGYDKWWCCIKLHIATLCFDSNFERKNLELHTFVNNSIFPYYYIV